MYIVLQKKLNKKPGCASLNLNWDKLTCLQPFLCNWQQKFKRRRFNTIVNKTSYKCWIVLYTLLHCSKLIYQYYLVCFAATLLNVFYHPMFSTILCFLPSYVFYHPVFNHPMFSTTLCFQPSYVFYHPMFSTILCFLPSYVFYHPMFSTTLCFPTFSFFSLFLKAL